MKPAQANPTVAQPAGGDAQGLPSPEGRVLYFAYGSNLDLAQMRERCPDSEPVGPARLPGYRLAFGGYSRSRKGGVATVLPSANGSFVQGYLFALSPRDLKRLDRFEAVPTMYERFAVQAGVAQGQALDALTYRLVKYRPKAPSDAYRDQIATAFVHHGFDAALLQQALIP